MKKTLCALALGALAAAAFAGQGDIPFISNAGSPSGDLVVRSGSLSEEQSGRLDLLASAAAARATLALRCESSRFESVSKSVERMFEAKAALIAPGPLAYSYARDNARTKYKAMVMANRGIPCSGLDNLRSIASYEGFYGDIQSR